MPSLEKRFFSFRLTGLTLPHFQESLGARVCQDPGGWVFSIYPSILTNLPSSLYSSSVSISVSSSPYTSLSPPLSKNSDPREKNPLLKLEKKSTQPFKKPFFRRVKEFLESSLAQNSLTVGARLCQGEFVVAIYAHIHKREAAQVFLAQF